MQDIPFYYYKCLPPTSIVSADELISGKGSKFVLKHEREELSWDFPLFELLPEDRDYIQASGTDKKNDWIISPSEKLEQTIDTFHIKRGRIYGDGLVMTPEYQLLKGFFHGGETGPTSSQYLLSQNEPIPLPQAIDERVIHAGDIYPCNYWHFLCYCLARYVYTASHEHDMVYLPQETPWQRQWAELLGIPQDRIIPSKILCHLECAELICSTTCIKLRWPLDRIREAAIGASKAAGASSAGGDKIYLTRSDAFNNRRLLNENQLTEYLKTKGFSIIDPSKLSVAEQVLTFAGARMVVSLHSAALANGAFCAPGTTFIEISHKDFLSPLQLMVANRNNDMRYYFFLSEKEEFDTAGLSQVRISELNNSANSTVNIEKFKRLLAKL